MELESYYEISRTADFIHSRNFTRVALQVKFPNTGGRNYSHFFLCSLLTNDRKFSCVLRNLLFPDELLKDSTRVVRALKDRLRVLHESDTNHSDIENEVRLFIMADTTYGSCCVDEVGAAHANADCVIHYGHTCLSPTTTLPALFVFGKDSIDVSTCAKTLSQYSLSNGKPVLVLFGLEYAHSMFDIRQTLLDSFQTSSLGPELEVHFADVKCSSLDPSSHHENVVKGGEQVANDESGSSENIAGARHHIGGLFWELPRERRMEDCSLFWIGSENSAFANVVLTFNGCEIVRYDAKESCLVTDVSKQRRILKRRYYLVEKAKDAGIVGILVGTLGLAGYLHIIHQMKELITGAGKKAYTLVMGKPNPAKLANFPECGVFIYVSCAQTALMDSKEYLAPVITPFEATLAFSRGSRWTGAYIMEFQDLVDFSTPKEGNQSDEARYSFLQGGYVEDWNSQENTEEENGARALVSATEKSLQLRDNRNSLIEGTARSGAEFFAARSFQGLDINNGSSEPEPYVIGRSGKASGYQDEKNR
ncbi:2-(3-amino-3-carboxypropyl)histidine synthase subunit 2 isoform X1 [Benincasa hispida]|uniref:2-(3-amino-3-carboxypropyl)histidine synthase subunit 2 isoform X1 n=1 Tax=Benincasa hispida TaxID=102211 RepID=UPI0019010AD4|nr:2-(3-amino-3-carboxypropyl)histidine synthase subunit 2 isoform X1 [Benincasa hispida]